jgi:predicted deacylase
LIERRLLRFDPLPGLELPCFDAVGEEGGPHLCLLGGIHGAEYSSIAAVVRFMRGLEPAELRGRITAVPVVSMTSYRARSAFVVPEDGKNLNRCFPGSLDGTFSDVLARCVFDSLIAPSDAVVDLHGGDVFEALEPFTLYDESPVAERAKELAAAFDFPYVVRMGEDAPATGMTSSAAASVGIPGVIAEAGGRGLLEDAAVTLLVDGLANALRQLGMLPGEPLPPSAERRLVDRFVWLRSAEEGWWEPAVAVGEQVAAGAVLGTVSNLYGDVLEEVVAPEDGVLLFVTSSPAVAADGLVLGLGAGLGPL